MQTKLNEYVKTLVGKFKQAYPPYSSCRVDGKPLFQWAREGTLNEIIIPTIEVEIFNLTLLENPTFYVLNSNEVEKLLLERICKVNGDFRQNEIIEAWKKILFFANKENHSFHIFRFKATVSSGTYIRSIANRMGDYLGTGAIAFDIYRTRVGNYSIEQAEEIVHPKDLEK